MAELRAGDYDAAMIHNTFGARATLDLPEGKVTIFRLDALAQAGLGELERLPLCIRVLLENVLRHEGNGVVQAEHVAAVARSVSTPALDTEVPFTLSVSAALDGVPSAPTLTP